MLLDETKEALNFEGFEAEGIPPYLQIKKLSGLYGCRIQNYVLYVPCRNRSGKIRSLQTIQPNGDKFFCRLSSTGGIHVKLG
jgi:phage/plasmid primase-like uncharacterized protein